MILLNYNKRFCVFFSWDKLKSFFCSLEKINIFRKYLKKSLLPATCIAGVILYVFQLIFSQWDCRDGSKGFPLFLGSSVILNYKGSKKHIEISLFSGYCTWINLDKWNVNGIKIHLLLVSIGYQNQFLKIRKQHKLFLPTN